MKKQFINLFALLLLSHFASVASASNDEGLISVITTASPFYLTAQLFEPSSNNTDNRKYQERDYLYKVKEQARDDAILFLATDGEQGKTAKFEAAAAEIRKEDKQATDYKVARIILGIQ